MFNCKFVFFNRCLWQTEGICYFKQWEVSEMEIAADADKNTSMHIDIQISYQRPLELSNWY